MHLYFAYGSNMDAAQMRRRCPGSELVGPAELRDYELGFTTHAPSRGCGCADVVPKPDATVYGLLYRMTDDDMARMDVFEGHPDLYCRTTVRVTQGDETVLATTYEVVAKQPFVPTSHEYLGLLRDAAALHAFPDAYQDFLASFIPNASA